MKTEDEARQEANLAATKKECPFRFSKPAAYQNCIAEACMLYRIRGGVYQGAGWAYSECGFMTQDTDQ